MSGAEWKPWTRQITGLPYQHIGYAIRGKERVPCGHRHRRRGWTSGSVFAAECAGRLARRLNREARP